MRKRINSLNLSSRSDVQYDLDLGCCLHSSRKETKKTSANDIHHHDLSKSDAIPLPIVSASSRRAWRNVLGVA